MTQLTTVLSQNYSPADKGRRIRRQRSSTHTTPELLVTLTQPGKKLHARRSDVHHDDSGGSRVGGGLCPISATAKERRSPPGSALVDICAGFQSLPNASYVAGSAGSSCPTRMVSWSAVYRLLLQTETTTPGVSVHQISTSAGTPFLVASET